MPRPADDDYDDRPRRPRRRDDEDDYDKDDYDDAPPRRRRPRADTTGGLIPYNNSLALTAYYVGVFGLIPCVGLLLGPVAVVLGVFGLRHARRHPQTSGTAHALVGIGLGVIEIVGHIAAVIYLVVAAQAAR